MRRPDPASVPVYLFLGIYFALSLWAAFYFSGTFDAGDSLQHYLYAHYGFEHPENFLDHWAKPVFTFLSAPFALFGFGGMKIFNCLMVLGAVWCTWRIARRLGYASPWFALLCAAAAPMFFRSQFSGLTEPMFAFVLSLGILLLLEKRMLAGAILLSFLPFVRTEGFLLLPVFALYLAWTGHLREILLLGTGLVLLSVVGALHYGDLLWVFTENPYAGGMRNYGSGGLDHFPKMYNFVVGVPIFATFWLGVAAALLRPFRPSLAPGFRPRAALLIQGCFAVYFGAHMYFWWTGTGHSMGLHRVLIAIVPLGALIAAEGLLALRQVIPWEAVRHGFTVLLALYILIFPFTPNHTALKAEENLQPVVDQELLQDVGEWYRTKADTAQRVYYAHPGVPFYLGLDPFDTTAVGPISDIGIGNLPPGSILIWDSWFAVQESGVGERFAADRPGRYRLLREFRGEKWGKAFTFRVFEKE